MECNNNFESVQQQKNKRYTPFSNQRKPHRAYGLRHLNKDLEKYRDFIDIKWSEKGVLLTVNQKFHDQLRYNQKYQQNRNLIASINDLIAHINNSKADLKSVYEEKKVKEQLLRDFSSRLSLNNDESSEIFGNKATIADGPIPSAGYFIANDYANLGYSLVSHDLNNDGFEDLVMGAPVYSNLNLYQNGIVFVVFADRSTGIVPLYNLNLEKSANLVIQPPLDSTRAKFGQSIAVLDLNLDGYKDLVVTAPSYDLNKIKYEVKIFLLLIDVLYCRFKEIKVFCFDYI